MLHVPAPVWEPPAVLLQDLKKNRGVVVTKAGSYSRLIDSCITQLKAQGPSSTCNERNEEEGEEDLKGGLHSRGQASQNL